ncbi:MAG TPA: AMP-binding protein [Acidimicrobiales bacterium]|nr:AMP-binding protein [Acidimicrobiales bacterium]
MARAPSSWADAARADGLPGGRGLNIAHEAVDRHATGAGARRPALRVLDRCATTATVTYGELRSATSRFARVLGALGVRRGETVVVLTGRVPALHVAVLGALKAGAVACPLSPAFGPEPARDRLVRGDAAVLVTTAPLLHRAAPILADVPSLRHVLVAGGFGRGGIAGGTVPCLDLDGLLAGAGDAFEIGPTSPEDRALLHFTSGTTGPPKAAVHVHAAVLGHLATARLALDLRPEDVFWCTADPGWVTGTSYGIVAPLACGATSIVDGGVFDASRWYGIIERERVSVWYTSPTALRMLMRAGDDLARRFDLTSLRVVASVGEPLAAECVEWGERALGHAVRDTWWQTETGAIMIANDASAPATRGAMGRALPGVEAAVVRCGDDGRALVRDGHVVVAHEPDAQGELALRRGWPSMFRGYLHDDDAYRACFAGEWYLTGDVARRDPDGNFWFVGRADDMIKSAGHFIGPFEVERVLMQHPAVAEAAAVGAPDLVAGEVVTAVVTLRDGYAPSEELRLDVLGWGRARLGPVIAPRRIAFTGALPHTTSGKVVRRAVRAGGDP